MSRYYDDYDGEQFPNESALWRANADRALKGKRGRKVLAELREALVNLPQKRLIEGALCTVDAAKREISASVSAGEGEGVCAVGAYLWWRKVKSGSDPDEAFAALPTLLGEDYGLEDTASVANAQAGVVYGLAWDLAYRNDETYGNATPEERYTKFLAWIDSELGIVEATS